MRKTVVQNGRKFLGALMACIFALNSTGISYAMPSAALPVQGAGSFAPVLIQGIRVHAENAMLLDFIVDPGQEKHGGDALRAESSRLVRYFMAALAVPEDDLWVNLSPYEKDRIVPEALGQTDLGRDMLAQDYLLKQVTASLMNPHSETGRKFWARVYARAQEKFGTIDIPVDTFNKVWIMPARAVVYQNGGKAVVLEASLKVMLDGDYLAAQNAAPGPVSDTLALGQDVIREVVLPVLEDEVNAGRDFAPLRQIYHALILAHWFRNNLKSSVLNKVYADKKRIRGIDLDDKQVAQKIWAGYVESFKKGVYNFIQEERDPLTDEAVPRKYFSGGETFDRASIASVFKVTHDAAEGKKFVKGEASVLVQVELVSLHTRLAPEVDRSDAVSLPSARYDPDILRQLDRDNPEARTAALQKLLSDQGLTREKAASLLGIGYTAYRNMEIKGRVTSRLINVDKLMDVLGIPDHDRDLFRMIFVPQAPPQLSFDALFREYGHRDIQTFCGRQGFIAFMKQRLGCTNEELAEKLGVGIIAIENWIKHEARVPTWDVLMRIVEKGGLTERVDIYRLVRIARGDPALKLDEIIKEAEEEILSTPVAEFDKVNFFSRLYLKMLAYSGLTENYIADLIGLHRQHLALWHSAVNKISPEQIRSINPENAIKLADAFIIDDPVLSRRLSYLFLGVARSGTIEEVLEQVKVGSISAGRMLRLSREQKGQTLDGFWTELVTNYSEKYGFYALTPQGGFRTLQKAETGVGHVRDEKLAYAIADYVGLQMPGHRDVFVNHLTEPRRFGYPPAMYVQGTSSITRQGP
jgi:transcriptional regulator with XRE-family HTH domain